MEAEVADPVALNLELLQLPDVSAETLEENLAVVNHLFVHWLALPDTAALVKSLIDKKSSSLPMFPGGNVPPLSPRSVSGTPRFTRRPSTLGPSCLGSPLKAVNEPPKELIPQFYFPNGRPPKPEIRAEFFSLLEPHFSGHLDGLKIEDFRHVVTDICKLPSFFTSVIFYKIDTSNTGFVTRDAFVEFWVNSNLISKDTVHQIFLILKQPNNKYLTHEDFKPVLRDILDNHPGLEFLKSTPEFQLRYEETVIYRIFYRINRSLSGRITLKEIRCGDLIDALREADAEEDINKVLRYFSYEHFYVIYCKFWELDTDHDFLIDKDDLIRYGNHALTYKIVNRVFSQVSRKFTSRVEGKMGYEDFVYFILSEEDKSSEPSLEYWFKCIDLDANGMLTYDELLFFFDEQLIRMESMAQERILFEDILCQLIDMIKPESETFFKLQDFKRSKLAGHFFNVLFNLNKFLAFESRDPFLIRQIRQKPHLTDWDRFAEREYIRLSMEEEDGSIGSADN